MDNCFDCGQCCRQRSIRSIKEIIELRDIPGGKANNKLQQMKKNIEDLRGVHRVRIDDRNNEIVVYYDDILLSPEKIKSTVFNNPEGIT